MVPLGLGSLISLTQYRTSATLVANIGILFATSRCDQWVFMGAGKVTFRPSNRLITSLKSILPPVWGPLGANLRSFKNIKLLFSTPIQPNVELEGFEKTFGRRSNTGARRNVLPQSPGPYNNTFTCFIRPFSNELYKAWEKSS